jgi:riboflavin synthase
MKALIQTGSSLSACGHAQAGGRVPVPLKSDFLSISAAELVPEMVRKGSVALDGVSLTLVDVSGERGEFSVHVIPHTWEHTALSALGPGDRLNLETDMIGKYVRSYLARSVEREPATWDRLRDAGFDGL